MAVLMAVLVAEFVAVFTAALGVAASAVVTPDRANNVPKAPAHRAALSFKNEKNRTNDPVSVESLV